MLASSSFWPLQKVLIWIEISQTMVILTSLSQAISAISTTAFPPPALLVVSIEQNLNLVTQSWDRKRENDYDFSFCCRLLCVIKVNHTGKAFTSKNSIERAWSNLRRYLFCHFGIMESSLSFILLSVSFQPRGGCIFDFVYTLFQEAFILLMIQRFTSNAMTWFAVCG